MTTFAAFRAAVATNELRDPSNQTFLDTDVADMVNDALVEVGRIAPNRFQEDLAPVANQLAYQLLSADFPDATPEIEVLKVELWDGSVTPNQYIDLMRPVSAEYSNSSASGWRCWNGTLELTNSQADFIDENINVIRVWGYAPYPPLVDDADVIAASNELQRAMRAYVRVLALRRLVQDRDLFTQWQTRSNNSDVSPASLLGAQTSAEDDWRRRARAIMVLREAP